MKSNLIFFVQTLKIKLDSLHLFFTFSFQFQFHLHFYKKTIHSIKYQSDYKKRIKHATQHSHSHCIKIKTLI